MLFAVLEFNKVVGSVLLNGLGIWYAHVISCFRSTEGGVAAEKSHAILTPLCCCSFLSARVSHAFYMFSPDSIPPIPFRAFGFLGTFVPIAVASFYNVVYGFHNRY